MSNISRETRVLKACAHCGNLVRMAPSLALNRNAYCNADCKREYATQSQIEYQCKNCGRPYKVYPSRATEKPRYCSPQCRHEFSHDIEKRLFEKRHVNPVTGCWEWTGCLDSWGYAQMAYDGKLILVHRLAAHHYKGFELKSKFCICHVCDNPKCFNPDHLFVGDVARNNLDKRAKGREKPLQGVQNGRAKLTEDDVRCICSRISAGESNSRIAEGYAVTPQLIQRIRIGKAWRHLTTSLLASSDR